MVKAKNMTLWILGSLLFALLLAYAVIQFFPVTAQ